MRITDLALSNDDHTGLFNIKHQCTLFLEQTSCTPLYKNLPAAYSDIHKVKVRKSKQRSSFSESFNIAFENHHVDLRQRAVFTNGAPSFVSEHTNDIEPYFIFPIDGFKFMYCTEVVNSSENYQKVFETIMETYGESKGNEMIAELLRFTYTSNDLMEGILGGSELIIYNIPYYFAVKETIVETYEDLIDCINNIS